MPMLGLGTWENDDPEECRTAVETALETGYRHIDTAQAYGNEAEVGDGIERADVDREDVFLATKVWRKNLAADDVRETTEESLDRLGVDSVDLLYMHWPTGTYDVEETFGAFEQLYNDGLIHRVGVSNFRTEDLKEALDVADVPIFAHQFECHPLLPQKALREITEAHDIQPVAYSPLARGEVFEVDELTEIAETYDTNEGQVSLAWLREKGVTTIPKATSEEHIRDNWGSLDLDLDDEDVAAIDNIDREERMVDPDFAPWN
ncbi:aldehyde reductase [Candidatus Halobonum tyrrellensis G22]|uniref:Aldehyde reductase n=2 Tax=Candidatus Halobonum TaxID=1431544 RepID=V4HE86_9EURY|nr:aldo/keto reductase [Candidatus Halobonum tyrrellensis]ESP88995.1 aldehyde reductase [Candidatus Halobonum tyrrellensis G22]